MRFVAINTEAQQEIQMLHRIRSRVMAERTALLNQIRGLLGEYDIVFGQGPSQVRRGIAALLTGQDPRLSAMARELVLGFQAELWGTRAVGNSGSWASPNAATTTRDG